MTNKRKEFSLWLVAGLAVAAYLITIGSPFLMDDIPWLVENSSFRHLIPSPADFSTGGITNIALRPVANFTFRLNYQISQLNVWSYHVFNILIHIGTGCLLLLLLVELGCLRKKAPDERTILVLATIVAALWVVHPLQVNAVTYIIQRYESLAAFFYLLSLYGFLRWRKGDGKNWGVVSLVSAFAAVGCKETAASLPLAIILLDRYFLSPSWRDVFSRRKYYLVLGASWVALAFLLISSQRLGWIHQEGGQWISFAYAKVQVVGLWHYIRLLFWPAPLVFDYGYWPSPRWFIWLPCAIVWLAILILSCRAMVRGSLFGYGLLLFFLLLAPSSSFFALPNIPLAEYRMYLPSSVLVAIFVFGAYELLTSRHSSQLSPCVRNFLVGAVVLIVLALLATTVCRNYVFRSSVALWADNLQKRPYDLNSYIGLADSLMNAGNIDDAEAVIGRAMEVFPENAKTLNLAGMIKFREKGLDEAEKLWLRAEELRPDGYDIQNNLGLLYASEERWEPARQHFEQLVELRPYDVIALGNLAQLCLLTKDYQGASDYTQRGLMLMPNDQVLRRVSAALEDLQWKK